MKTASGELVPTEETKPRRKAWSLRLWLFLIALVLTVHVGLIFVFGARKAIMPRPVMNVPELELAKGPGQWLTLNDPTLFALPSREGFAESAWLEPPRLRFLWPEWITEPPHWLPLPVGELGAVFSRFMQTNRLVTFRFDIRPPPQFTVPAVPLGPAFAPTSTFHLEGDLAKRSLLTSIRLPSWAYTDVLRPSKVQVLVNAAGQVVSAVLLSSSGYAAADQRALTLVRTARFAPASGLTVGQFIFDWRVIAPPATNAPPIL